MFKSRVALAATLSSNYGIYNGFELLEHEPIPGREEYLNSEKYEIKVRDWNKPGNIKAYIARLNRVRRDNAALQQTSNLRFLPVDDGNVIGFVKESVDQTNAVAVRDRAVARRRTNSGCHFGDIQVGTADERRNVARGREPDDRRAPSGRMGRRAPADRSGARSRPAVPLSGVRARHERDVVHRCQRTAVKPTVGDELWYKDAIIYQLHVKAFADSNNDGIGDFAGLTEKLDYLQDLGVTALWLLPFYPSPGRDDGYDIADYGDINPDFGTMKDFRRFMQEAKRRGLRVITELVINHTSDQHDWFKRARAQRRRHRARATGMSGATPTRNTRARASSSPTPRNRTGPGIRKPAQFYWHRFFSHQPDLNFDNPRVVSARGAGDEALARLPASTASASTPFPISASAKAPTTRTCPRPTPIIKQLRAELDAYAPGQGAAGRSQPMAGGRAANISATATNATWPITSR